MSERRVGILKKISLSGMAEGWGDDCFVLVQPASYQEFKEYTKTDVETMTETQGIDMITTLAKAKFVSGKIMILDDENKLVLDDMQKDDLDTLGIEMLNKIFTQIMGVSYDPKAMPTAATNKKKSLKSENATAE